MPYRRRRTRGRRPRTVWVRQFSYEPDQNDSDTIWAVNLFHTWDRNTDLLKANLLGPAVHTEIPPGSRVERIIGVYRASWNLTDSTPAYYDQVIIGIRPGEWLVDSDSVNTPVVQGGSLYHDPVAQAQGSWAMWDSVGPPLSLTSTVAPLGTGISEHRFDVKSRRVLRSLGERPIFSTRFAGGTGAGPAWQHVVTSTLVVLP